MPVPRRTSSHLTHGLPWLAVGLCLAVSACSKPDDEEPAPDLGGVWVGNPGNGMTYRTPADYEFSKFDMTAELSILPCDASQEIQRVTISVDEEAIWDPGSYCGLVVEGVSPLLIEGTSPLGGTIDIEVILPKMVFDFAEPWTSVGPPTAQRVLNDIAFDVLLGGTDWDTMLQAWTNEEEDILIAGGSAASLVLGRQVADSTRLAARADASSDDTPDNAGPESSGGEMWIATLSDGTLVMSPDQFETTTEIDLNTPGESLELFDVAYRDGIYLLVGAVTTATGIEQGITFVSHDLVTWASTLMDTPPLRAVAASGQTFVVTGEAGIILQSTYGAIWQDVTPDDDPTDNLLYDVAVSDSDEFFAVGEGGARAWSIDGVVWETLSAGGDPWDLYSVLFHDGDWHAVGTRCVRLSSAADLNTLRDPLTVSGDCTYLKGLTVLDEAVIAAGPEALFINSDREWATGRLNAPQLTRIAADKNQLIAIDDYRRLLTANLRQATENQWTTVYEIPDSQPLAELRRIVVLPAP